MECLKGFTKTIVTTVSKKVPLRRNLAQCGKYPLLNFPVDTETAA